MSDHSAGGPGSTNHLVHETSPYLLQHAHNPVDWYPWSEEALAKARRLDRPIFLSIGYSACHWCHVMEHESFEDPDVARFMNEHFVNIKVDREERPDLDQIYMNFVQMQTGHGGWPMSVFLTPDARPFFGGTYFPPRDHGPMPSFLRVLTSVARAWEERRAELAESAGQMADQLRAYAAVDLGDGGDLDLDLVDAAARAMRRHFDSINGGFGAAPKFPHPMDLKVLLRVWKRTGDAGALDMVRLTLDKMARGGIYDHLGGGFHRYSVDERWLVPHFEKMLYDNALLASVYLEAYQATSEPFYASVARQTLDFMLRAMTAPEGGFFSTLDADSEGHEGKFYVWSKDAIDAVLGPEDAEVFDYVYDVSPGGNWEGQTILNLPKPLAQSARLLNLDEPTLDRRLAAMRRKLLEVRERRVRPGRDEKVLVSWNGLAIAALAQAANVLGEPRYGDAARAAAGFILERIRDDRGRLLHSYKDQRARFNAYLDDYTNLIDALVWLYEAGFEPHWVATAKSLAGVLIDQFGGAPGGGFYYTAADHEPLVARTKDIMDSSTPSGNGMAATALARLGRLTGDSALVDQARATLRACRRLMADQPTAAGQLLVALDSLADVPREVVIVGDPPRADTAELLTVLHRRFLPNTVVALANPAAADPEAAALIPMLRDRPAQDGQTTLYLCENFTCAAPLVGAAARARISDL